MSPPNVALSNDQRAIDELVRAFFDLFTNRGGVTPNLRAIFDLCVPEAIISKCATSPPEVTSLEAFIAPREALLSGGALTDFHEVEVAQHTQVFGNIAQRASIYRKSGILNGTRFEVRGVKVFQFIRCPEGWRISAVSWDDEREGFSVESVASGGNRSDVTVLAKRLLDAVEIVFDSDWSYTMSQLGIDPERQARAQAELLRIFGEQRLPEGARPGTFLRPSDPDAAQDNWGNYGALLDAYAELRRKLASPDALESSEQQSRPTEKLAELYDELTAEDGSFMIQLRGGSWHEGAFRRFIRVAHQYLEDRNHDASIPRWVADGFWELEHLTSEWLSRGQPGSDRAQKYRARVETVQDLAAWLFTGAKPRTFDLDADD